MDVINVAEKGIDLKKSSPLSCNQKIVLSDNIIYNSFLKKNWPFIFVLLLFFSDIFYLNLAFYISLNLRFPGYNIFTYIEPLLVANIIFLPSVVFLGLYRGVFKASLERQKSQIGRVCIYTGILTMAYLYITKSSDISRAVILIFVMAMYVILEINHSILYNINRLFVKKGLGSKNTVIVGTDESAGRFAEQLRDVYGDFYNILGFFKNNDMEDHSDVKSFIIDSEKNINEILKEYNVEQVFIVSDSMDLEKYTSVRRACENFKVNLKMVSPYVKNLMKKRKIKDITGVPLVMEQKRQRFLMIQRVIKRLLDLSVLLSGSIFIIPLCFFVALVIKLTSKGPVFFIQKRSLYKGGPEIKVYKFRTMCADADKMKKDLIQENETNGALFKMKNDPRITPAGNILRKFSIDEFPQFINVLKGEMSIVGPRPLPVRDFKMLKNTDKLCFDWYKKRGQGIAGITGLWQIMGRSELTFEEMCFLDLYYIENQSLFFDLEIMFETLYVMIFGRGAY